jgi:Ca2+:H+ antiporter
VALVAAKLVPAAHTLLFVLLVLAIVPLAALLSHATESVAEKTGDTAGGLLNATLGNLTELVIAAAALRAGDYALVKGSIAGAIVTNTPFHARRIVSSWRSQAPYPGVQPRHRPSGCGFALPGHDCARESLGNRESYDLVPGAALTQKLSVALAVLLSDMDWACCSHLRRTAKFLPARSTPRLANLRRP